MRYLKYLFLCALIFAAVSCKKTSVDGSNRKAFQESINDMATSLTTLKQVKFNEALYILKTFGVEAEGDLAEIEQLGKMLDGKKIGEIFAMANEVAKKNGIDWSSDAPPSLGEMNIFGNDLASEKDSNDIEGADGISINIKTLSGDSISGPRGIVVYPVIVDNTGNKIDFSGAALETIMEVSSGGTKLSTSKNLMQDPNFRGFTILFSSLDKDKIFEDVIDVKLSVKTSNKNLQMIKTRIPVNSNALNNPLSLVSDSTQVNQSVDDAGTSIPETSDPKATVSKFLSNLSSQNYKAAYDISDNPNWGSFDKFSNPSSGFGSVKNIAVKNISTPNNKDNTATVNVSYDVTDKNGQVTSLNVTYGLKAINSNWKITSYKINK